MRVKISGVYAIRNKLNGRCYIGSTVDKVDRWRRHKRCLRLGTHQNIHLQRAWDKYGEDAFELVWLQDVPAEQLLDVEQEWLNANADGYNIATCAEAFMRGRKMGPMSPERRAKISAANKGRVVSEESRKKMSEAQLANSALTRQRLLGHEVSQETREKIRAGNLGKKMTDEQRAKLSAALVGNQFTKGHKLTEEHKEKIRQGLAKSEKFKNRKRKPRDAPVDVQAK